MRRVAFSVFLLLVLLVSFISQVNAPGAYYYKEVNREMDLTISNEVVAPVIYHPDKIDRDFDGVADDLENTVSRMEDSAVVPVIVTLYNPVRSQDLNYFTTFGGNVTDVYRYVTYGFAGLIPAVNVSKFARMERNNLVVIEHDAPVEYHLDVNVPLIRARPHVWKTYGYTGSPNHSIAIIDTGIDDAHPDVGPYGNLDFSKKIVGWYDASGDNAPTPQDYGEHGTHVAGIAAGTGVANNLQGEGNVTTTFTWILPPNGYGYIDYIDVTVPGVIRLTSHWSGSNNVLLRLYDPSGNTVAQTSGKTGLLTLTYDTVGTAYPTGRYRVLIGNLAGKPGNPFSVQETYPYLGRNDGYNLFTGVAPSSKLVGVKVFDNSGSGTSSSVMAGMEWVIANRLVYNIVVASMSLGLEDGTVSNTLDQKADTLVEYGIVTVVSAGNDYPDYTIGSPGTAAYVLTVAATNEENGITDYSSNGDIAKNEFGLIKPDVAAPGGTFQSQFGNQIVSADSNDVDAAYSGYFDQNADDYQQMAGTSMAAPHVAGLASLVIQAFGDWNWSLEEALKVKMIIGMTSFETQNGEGSNTPLLNRGDKDNREGYGRVSADAAIEAATMTYRVAELATDMFGSNSWDKKVWARQVSLLAGGTYEFRLSVPSGADYDLYLYDGSPDTYGQPVILAKSVNASKGGLEAIRYTPPSSGVFYLVVKWVNGSGVFTLESSGSLYRDVAVVWVSASADVVYAGSLVNITVDVRNEGEVSETVVVAARYNDSVVETKTVYDLALGVTKTIEFAWNTTGVSHGYYIILGEASPVSEETDLADNTLVGGTVHVKIPGDINGDDHVDVYDAVSLSTTYGSKPEDPNWDSEADINGDGFIDVFDAVVLSTRWTG